MVRNWKFCGLEEAHEGHGWAHFTEDGRDFDMYDCYGLPDGWFADEDE